MVAGLACSHREPPSPGTGSNGANNNGNMTGSVSGTSAGNVTGSQTGGTPTTQGTSSGVGGASSGGSTDVGSLGSGNTTSPAGGTGGGPMSTIVPGAEGFDCTPSDGSQPNLTLTKLIGDLDAPTGVFGPPGETERLFILLQGGRIEILRGGAISGTLLDISDKVDVDETNQHEERGLLGMAFHPDFQNNGKFFVTYTSGNANDGNLTQFISEFTATGDSAGSERVIAQFAQPENNHNGGGMAIGLDGQLYVGMGDGGWNAAAGAAADPHQNAQNPSSLLGKILRFSLDGSPSPGNMPGAAPEVWDMGLRNPWRIAVDGCTGDFYIADVGYEDDGSGSQPTEEVNIEAPGAGHKNYGWPMVEGTACRESGCDTTPFTMPAQTYPTPSGAAIIGGYVYRGSRIPGLRGTYLYTDYGQGRFWAFEYVGGAVTNSREITDDINPGSFQTGNFVSFGQDSAGEMYVIAWTNGGQGEGPDAPPATIGDVYRIDPE